jgi:Flp pilus assembly protein TadG
MSPMKPSLPVRNRFADFASNQRGSISVIAAVTLVPLLIAAGSAVDMARANRTLGHMQKAVDAAALAGAATHKIVTAEDEPLAGDEARIAAASKMVVANLPLEIASIAEAAEVAVDGTEVTVDLAAVMPTTFMSLVGIDTMSLSVTAVADFSKTGNGCIVALGADGDGIEVGGTVDVQAGDCWLHSNKVGDRSINVVGNVVVAAGGTHAVGSTKVTNNATMPSPENVQSYVYPPVTDPLAEWDHPVVPGPCAYDKYSDKGTGGTVTLPAGVYCGGLQLSGYDDIQLQPGIYFFLDGAVTINSKADLTGHGVGFYLGRDVKSFTINGGSDVDLSAYDEADNSPMDGKLVAMEAVDPDLDELIAVKINGGSGLDLAGTIYLPTGELEIAGNSATGSIASLILAHSIKLSGVATLNFEQDLKDGVPVGPEFVTAVKLVK